MHSNDFDSMLGEEPIGGKTRAQWEADFGIVGLIEHLKDLGWSRYQWNLRTEEDIAKAREYWRIHHAGKELPSDREPRCFAEFFGTCFQGYLRGDAATVRGAVEVCVARAQRYAGCRQHTFAPYKSRDGVEYDNGLIACTKCGFNGYSNAIKTLECEVTHLRIALRVEKEASAERERWVEEHGEPWHKQFQSLLPPESSTQDAKAPVKP